MLNIKGFKVKYCNKRDLYQAFKDNRVCWFQSINQVNRCASKLFNLGVSFRSATKKEINTFNGGNVYCRDSFIKPKPSQLSDLIDFDAVIESIDAEVNF